MRCDFCGKDSLGVKSNHTSAVICHKCIKWATQAISDPLTQQSGFKVINLRAYRAFKVGTRKGFSPTQD